MSGWRDLSDMYLLTPDTTRAERQKKLAERICFREAIHSCLAIAMGWMGSLGMDGGLLNVTVLETGEGWE